MVLMKLSALAGKLAAGTLFLTHYLLGGEFLSKMWSDFLWPLGGVDTVGGATMAKAEPPMQPLSK